MRAYKFVGYAKKQVDYLFVVWKENVSQGAS